RTDWTASPSSSSWVARERRMTADGRPRCRTASRFQRCSRPNWRTRRWPSDCVSSDTSNERSAAMKRHDDLHSRDLLTALGVPEIAPRTSPFDPGYDPITLAGHLDQSSHLMEILKVSMACWIVADERATREKIAAAKSHEVPTVTGGGPFEVSAAQGQLDFYLDLCADFGFTRIECGEGFTDLDEDPAAILRRAGARALEVQFELGKKHG